MRWWIKAIIAVAVLILLLVVCIALGKMLLKTLDIIDSDGGVSVADPMYAETEENATRPPELSEDSAYDDANSSINADASVAWADEVQTPVDMTVDDLAQEAAAETN